MNFTTRNFQTSQSGFNFVNEISFDSHGDLFVADEGNARVLEFDNPLKSSGLADRVFGQGPSGTDFTDSVRAAGPYGLSGPFAAGFDAAGNMLISDAGNFRVVEYDQPTPTPVAERLIVTPATLNFGKVAINSAGKTETIRVTHCWSGQEGSSHHYRIDIAALRCRSVHNQQHLRCDGRAEASVHHRGDVRADSNWRSHAGDADGER